MSNPSSARIESEMIEEHVKEALQALTADVRALLEGDLKHAIERMASEVPSRLAEPVAAVVEQELKRVRQAGMQQPGTNPLSAKDLGEALKPFQEKLSASVAQGVEKALSQRLEEAVPLGEFEEIGSYSRLGRLRTRIGLLMPRVGLSVISLLLGALITLLGLTFWGSSARNDLNRAGQLSLMAASNEARAHIAADEPPLALKELCESQPLGERIQRLCENKPDMRKKWTHDQRQAVLIALVQKHLGIKEIDGAMTWGKGGATGVTAPRIERHWEKEYLQQHFPHLRSMRELYIEIADKMNETQFAEFRDLLVSEIALEALHQSEENQP